MVLYTLVMETKKAGKSNEAVLLLGPRTFPQLNHLYPVKSRLLSIAQTVSPCMAMPSWPQHLSAQITLVLLSHSLLLNLAYLCS